MFGAVLRLRQGESIPHRPPLVAVFLAHEVGQSDTAVLKGDGGVFARDLVCVSGFCFAFAGCFFVPVGLTNRPIATLC